MDCPACRFSNPAPAKFCGGCGIPIVNYSHLDDKAERRILSVIFCDIVGSTALSEAIDPEELRELLSNYHDACMQVVEAYGGYLAHLLGDGVVIYFGYPKAHEDDEARAVHCALAIQETIGELAARKNYHYQVRIGIHRGMVVVGSLGGASSRSESFAIGETPNIAARLQAEAAPGSVVVSRQVWKLVSNNFESEHLGSRQPKGVRRPIEVYRITKPKQEAGKNKSTTNYTGREKELKMLYKCWQASLDDRAQAILIRGEPGVGKSRITEHFLDLLKEENKDITITGCNPFTSETPYFPLAEMLRNRLGTNKLNADQTVEAVAAELARLKISRLESLPLIASFLNSDVSLEAWPALNGISQIRRRRLTHELVIELLLETARRSPLIVVIEDLHWADPSTINLLDQLLGDMGEARLMIMLTARLEFTCPWAKQSNCTDVLLECFTSSESVSIIRDVANGKALPPDVARQIYKRAEGNPLFLEEITLSVLASAGLVEKAGTWILTQPLSADMVPASLETALMSRLDRLGSSRNLLQLCATIGREFRIDLLASIASIEIDDAELAMENMVDQGFILTSPGDPYIYRFKHALIQDVAYQSLLRSTRQQNHSRIAAVITESFPDLAKQHPELMAHHLSGAERYAESAQMWLKAGLEAAGRSAVHETVEHLTRGLIDLQQLPEGQDCEPLELQLQTSLAPAQMAAFGWAAPIVESTCLRAIQLADRMNIEEHRFALLWGLWSNQFVAGQLKRALDSANELQIMAQDSGSTMHAIAAHNASSYTHFYRGEYSLAIEYADKGLSLFTKDIEAQLCLALQSAPTVHILSARSNALWMLGRQQEAYEGMEKMEELARSLNHPPSLAAALCYLCFFHYYDQNWNVVLAAASEALAISMAEGYSLWHACASLYKAASELALNPHKTNPSLVVEAAMLFRETGSLVTDPSTTTIIMTAHAQEGKLDDAIAQSERGLSSAREGHVKVVVSEIYRQRGELLAAHGRHQEADQAFQNALDAARAQAAISLELRALISLMKHRHPSGIQPEVEGEMRQILNKIQPASQSLDMSAAHSLLARLA